jgi:hypothetical protein
MRNGSLHLYGTSMHIPIDQVGSLLNFTIATSSQLSVLVSDYPSTFSIDFTVASNTTGTKIILPTPLVSTSQAYWVLTVC